MGVADPGREPVNAGDCSNMKKHICECGGCRKTATVKLKNGHRVCEDCYKGIRRTGAKVIWKEALVGHLGDPKDHIDLCIDYPVKIR